MTDKVLNNPFKGLLFANQSITPLKPVLQQFTGTQRDLFHLLDMFFKLCVCQAAERSVCGCAQAADG